MKWLTGGTQWPPEQVRLLVNPACHKQAMGLPVGTNGNAGLLRDRLPAERFRVSASMPDVADKFATAISYAAGTPALGMFMPTWAGVEMIVDPYTKAKAGQKIMTAVNGCRLRNGGFRRLQPPSLSSRSLIMLEYRYSDLEREGRTLYGIAMPYGSQARIGSALYETFQRGAFGDVSALDVLLNVQHKEEKIDCPDRRRRSDSYRIPKSLVNEGGLARNEGSPMIACGLWQGEF